MEAFSSKYLNNYKTLNQATLGFELEFFSNHSLYKLLELLNIELSPIKVHFRKQYHSNFEPDATNFVIEPDFSGGTELVEIITGPMPYVDAVNVLISLLKFIDKYGETDDKCSIHVNISFKDKPMSELNKLKLVLDLDENYIYRLFPEREGNIYAKSIKRIIPYEDWESSAVAINKVSEYLTLPEDTKYYGVNLSASDRGWLEYRYIGGDNYQKKISSILELVDYFIMQTYDAIGSVLNQEHYVKLSAYLDKNIQELNKYKNYNGFLAMQPNIDMQVDRNRDYDYVKSIYPRFYLQIFNLFNNVETFTGGTINYDTSRSRLEIVQATITNAQDLNNIDLIECNLKNGQIDNCELVNCDVEGFHIVSSKIRESRITKSKLTGCVAMNGTKLTDCYFFGGTLMDAKMEGGVFRSGKLTKDTVLSKETLKPKRDNFWMLPGSGIKPPKKIASKTPSKLPTKTPFKL